LGLHRVENTSHTKAAVTLHIYIPAFSESQSFDEKTGIARTCQISFYSKHGSKCVEN
jgi:cysteine dioxygenase